MTKKIENDDKSMAKWRLTGKNLKFLQLLVKGMKVAEAHRLAGYSGQAQASYALKCKLKAQLAKLFETEGVSKDRYMADLLQLLNLPCLDPKTGKPIESLKFDQYMAVRKLLREELPSNKVAVPSITAFIVQRYSDDRDTNQKDSVVQRYGQPQDEKKDKDFIDISPISGRSVKRT